MSGNKTVTATFTGGGTKYEESAASFDGWTPYSDSSGTYRASKVTGNTAQFTFSGTSVKWLTKKGPTSGKASVTIDGVAKGTFDLYASTAQSASVSFTGLASTSHKIIIKVLGTKNAAATDYRVAVDGFTVGTTTTQENSVKVLYDTWKGVTASVASGGTYRVATTAGHTSAFAFSGTGVDWITYTGPGWGKAEVYIDGVDKGTVDLYASTSHPQTAKTYGGLAAGAHTITVKVLGTKNAAANSTAVPIDAFVVH
jgi:bacillopeptidase F